MADITTVSAAVTSLKGAIDIATFIITSDVSLKKSEAKLKLVELANKLAEANLQITSVQQELLDSQQTIRDLKAKLGLKGNVTFKRPYYLVEGDTSPRCQQCYDSKDTLTRLQGNGDGHWECKTCDRHFYDENWNPRPARAVLSGKKSWMGN